MTENLMCSSQKANSKEFNENYDRIFGKVKTYKVTFVKDETVNRYVNGQLVDDIEWYKRIDRTKNPFVEIEKEQGES